MLKQMHQEHALANEQDEARKVNRKAALRRAVLLLLPLYLHGRWIRRK